MLKIGKTPESPINRDVMKTNEVTKDVHHSTNVNVESQTIEYATNPTKFKEDLEVAILEGKATGETVLKTIENLVNGGKEDIGDPERRSLNEIKEAVIRVKTAPEMNLIATGDLNSQEVLDTLKINGIEKFNPDDPDLPENVKERLDEVRKSGGEIEAFYDKTTNKIFINENVEDGETRALVAREWKISEDLKDGKGKANDEGQLKATVAGELAYDDMMKRAGEGKTRSISMDELHVGVMDANSEVTADNLWDKGKAWVAKRWEDSKQFAVGVKKEFKKLGAETGYQARKVVNNKIALKQKSGDKNPKKHNEIIKKIKDDRKATTRKKKQYDAEAIRYKAQSEARKKQIDKNLKAKEEKDRQNKVAKKNRDKESKKAINSLKEQIKATRDPKKRKKLQDQLEIVEPHIVREGLKSAGKALKDTVASAPFIPVVEKVGKVVLASPSLTVGGLFLLTSQNMGTNDQFPHLKNLNNEKYSLKESEYIKNNYPYYYKDYEVSKKTTTKKNTFDKKKIDLEIAGKYSDKWKKEENARAIGEIAGGFLGGALAKGISKTIVKKSENLNIGKLFEKVKTAPVVKNYYNVIGTTKEENFKIRNITSKYDDFYGYEYNAYTNPGPLAELNDHPHLNFYGGRYNSRVLTEDTIYYRAGDANNKYGRYFVETPPKSVIQVRMDIAVKPYWTNKRTGMWEKNDLGIDISGKSKIEKIYTVRVPAGTVIYEGPVAPQGGMYLGGMETNQIFLPDTRLPGIEFFEYVK